MDENKIKEIFSDEAFVRSLFALEDAQEVQIALQEKGLVLSIKEIEEIRERLTKGDGELSEEELDNVAGGVAISLVIGIIVILAGGAVAAGGLTALAGSLINTATNRRW